VQLAGLAIDLSAREINQRFPSPLLAILFFDFAKEFCAILTVIRPDLY